MRVFKIENVNHHLLLEVNFNSNSEHLLPHFQGFKTNVTLKKGFTVLNNATASLDILGPVSGYIDLRNTGTLQLEGDLYLGSNVTFSGGGYIKGEKNEMFTQYFWGEI